MIWSTLGIAVPATVWLLKHVSGGSVRGGDTVPIGMVHSRDQTDGGGFLDPNQNTLNHHSTESAPAIQMLYLHAVRACVDGRQAEAVPISI